MLKIHPMKKTLFLLSLVTLFLSACGPSQKDVLKYHDEIIGYLNRITTIHNNYQLMGDTRATVGGVDALEKFAKETADSITFYVKKIESTTPVATAEDFKSTAVGFAKAYQNMYDNCAMNEIKAYKEAGTDGQVNTETINARYEECNKLVDEKEKLFKEARKKLADKYKIQVLM